MAAPVIPLPPELVHAVESQSAVLFLGAAASFGAHRRPGEHLPTGNQLRDSLADRFLAGQLKDKPLAAVAEYAVNDADLVSVQRFVRELFDGFRPAAFHDLIGKLRWHAIVTTNYDLIIEQVYQPGKAPLQQLVRFLKDGQHIETEMKGAVDGVPYLKLHGSIDHYSDNEIPLILATEQYARYSLNRTRLFERFKDFGREFPIIFCGYSISDPHIQNILFELFENNRKRPMYYIVDPNLLAVEERYWSGRRTAPIRATFEQFLIQLDRDIRPEARALPQSIGGGTTTLRSHYKVAHAPESQALLFFLSGDVDHVRKGMPVTAVEPKQFYRGAENDWGAFNQDLDVPRSVTDNLVVDAVLAEEESRPGTVDLYVIKGPAGNGKTIVLKRAAWMAAHDYDKIVLFLRGGGAIRPDAIEELYRYTQERIFFFVDKAALYVDEIRNLIEFARSREIQLTVIVAERDAEWNVRCESLDKYGARDFPVRYLSEKAIRVLLRKLEQHASLGLLKEVSSFEDRVQKLMGGAKRQLLVALHEATLGKAFEDIVHEEYQRIIPSEAQDLYLDVCTLNRLGVGVRAGLIARVSGIEFVDFDRRFFKPLSHIVSVYRDRYSGDWIYAARHEHVAQMVFDRVLSQPETRYDQLIRITNGINLDYSSDRTAFSQMVRGHSISEALRSRELGRAFFEAATRVAPREAFVFQQRGIFEMEDGGDLSLAEQYLNRAHSIDPHNKSILHSLALLARKQALATTNPLLRKKMRDQARGRLASLIGAVEEHSYGYHTAAQVALDDLRDIVDDIDEENPDPLLEKRFVDAAKDFERYVQEGLQKFPLNAHLLALEASYREIVHQAGPAEAALKKAFAANPRQDWIAIRLARSLESAGKPDEAKEVLIKCTGENPASKRIHYELAQFYLRHPKDGQGELIYDHLRRSFTAGDNNYEAQFWFAREAFLLGKLTEAKEGFLALKNAPMPPQMRNEVRGVVTEKSGGTRIYVGEIMKVDASYMFVHSAEFAENVFIHRSKAIDSDWRHFRRGEKVTFTMGFNMRGPTAATVRRLD